VVLGQSLKVSQGAYQWLIFVDIENVLNLI